MPYLSIITLFVIMLLPLFPPVILALVDGAEWSFARFQNLIGNRETLDSD